MYEVLKRIFDILFSLFFLILFSPLYFILFFLIWIEDRKNPLYFSKRVGRENKIFLMPKFRSMKVGSPQLATHLIRADEYLTRIGKIIRKYSLDELPQFFSVLIGDMSLVGPRPALFNQEDLIELRTKGGVHKLRPGITGWAQINGRDELSSLEKAKLDQYYLMNANLWMDFKILLLTTFKTLKKDGVSH